MANIVYRAAFIGTATIGSMVAQSANFDAIMQDGVISYVHPVSDNTLYAGADISAGGAKTSLRTSLISLDVCNLLATASTDINGVTLFNVDATVASIATTIINGNVEVSCNTQLTSNSILNLSASTSPIIANAISVSASSVTGDGAALVLSISDLVDCEGYITHPITSDYTGSAQFNGYSSNKLEGSSDVDVSSALTVSATGITADGAALALSDVTDVIGSCYNTLLGVAPVTTSLDIDNTVKHSISAYSDVNVSGLSLSISSITSDGAALVLSNVTAVQANPGSVINAESEIIAKAIVDVSTNPVNRDVYANVTSNSNSNITVVGIIGDGVGVFVTESTDIEAVSYNDSEGSADIDIPSTINSSDVIPSIEIFCEVTVNASGVHLTAPSIVGFGGSSLITSGDVECISQNEINGIVDINTTSNLAGTSSSIILATVEPISGTSIIESVTGVTNNGAGVFISDVTDININVNVINNSIADDGRIISCLVESDITIVQNCSGDINASGVILSASGVLGDGAAIILSNTTNTEAESYSAITCYVAVDATSIYVDQELISQLSLDGVAEITGLDTIISVPAIIGFAAGVFVNDVTTLEVSPTVTNNASSTVNASGIMDSVSSITGPGAGVFVSDVTNLSVISAIESDIGTIDIMISEEGDFITGEDGDQLVPIDPDTDMNISSFAWNDADGDVDDIIVSAASVSSAAISGDGSAIVITVGDVINSTATNEIDASSAIICDSAEVFTEAMIIINGGSVEVTSNGGALSVAAIIGNGAGVFLSDTAEVSAMTGITNYANIAIETEALSDASANTIIQGFGVVTVTGANNTVANTISEAAAVTLSDVTNITAIANTNAPVISDIKGSSVVADSEAIIVVNGAGEIDGSGLIITTSAISNNGAAMVMTDLASIEGGAFVTFYMGANTPIDANVVIETWPTVEANWNALVDVVGVDGTVETVGVGVIISDVVNVDAEASVEYS